MPLINPADKIFDAAETGDLQLLKQCLAAGVSVDIPDKRKSPKGVPVQLTPLMWACRMGQASMTCAGLSSCA